MNRSASMLHRPIAFATMLLVADGLARADIVDIAWGAEGRFEHRFEIAPGKFAELCGKLDKGQSVRWSFESAAPLDFNIHYHVGKDVVYPAQMRQVSKAGERLTVTLAQDYCWMWTNKTAASATVSVQLQR